MRLDAAASPDYYVLSSPGEEWQSGLIVRARSAEAVRSAQQAAARLSTASFAVESYAVSTLVAEGRRNWQAGAVVLSFLACAAILLSVVGLSSTIAEESTRRIHEFAIRSAVGAGPSELRLLVAREGAFAVAKIIAIGGPASALVVGAVRPLLFSSTPALGPSFAASTFLAIVVLLATSLPALHLSRVDAAEVLRAGT
jgi:ABC-type antimicrobial peptide transport system permease subunit